MRRELPSLLSLSGRKITYWVVALIGGGFIAATVAETATPNRGGTGHRDATATTNPYSISVTSFRWFDGRNSGGVPEFGAAHTPLLRRAPASYPGDGSGTDMIGPPDRPNPRTISNEIVAQDGQDVPNALGLTDYIWAWGQFLDHDIDLSEVDPANGTADIPILDPNDPLGPYPIPFNRSDYAAGTGVNGIPREQMNDITAFVDGSNVYGSDQELAEYLREFQLGRLRTTEGNLLPTDHEGFFVAGDVRANENVALTSMHTLFMREHNRIANLLATVDPAASDEDLFHLSRKIVSAELQIITYKEFLPALLGHYAPTPEETAYDHTIDSSINNEFSTAFYRVGHTFLSPHLPLAEDGVISGHLSLRDAFFNPSYLQNDPLNVDRLLGGLALQTCQEVDTMLVDDVRNFLFGPPGAGGLDLASLNIQRGRDHGLPDYNTLRDAYGLPRVTTFAEITSDPNLQQGLANLYGSVDNIDAWVGALAEDHLPGVTVGELLAIALREQFTRILAGDCYAHVNDDDLDQPAVQAVVSLATTRLADVVRRNSTVTTLQDDLFHAGPARTTDVVVTYDVNANRIYLIGNHLENSVMIVERPLDVMIVGTGGTRVNGKSRVTFETFDRPHLTIDLGGGNDSVTLLNASLGHVIAALGDGDDLFRSIMTVAELVSINPGSGTDRVTEPSTLLAP